MAVVWGAWSSNNRLRAGVEVTMSPSTVTSSTVSVTITTKSWLQSRFASNESGSSSTWFITGSVANGSGNTDWNVGDMGTKLMGTTTQTVTLSYGASQSRSATSRIHSYFAYPGTEATASTSITVPARPFTASAAPSSFTVARLSDTQQKLTWTNNPTTAAPYTNIEVRRKDNVNTAYVTVATLGVVTTYTDTATVADRVYTYAIRSKNSAGYSGYVYSSNISTTPAAPAAPTAAKNPTGDIVVTRGSLSSAAVGGWEVWHAANGVWDAARLALVAQATTSWTHVAPDTTKTHTYRLRAVSSGPTLTSADSAASNVVQLLTAPLAPTALSPSGVPWDATTDLPISWQHNPVDTTEQTYRENRYRVNGGAWVQPGRFATSSKTRTYAAGTFTNGTTVEWQARTWGALFSASDSTVGASPWSDSAVLTMSTTPTVAVSSPDPLVPWGSSSLSVSWAYFDADGHAQSQWKVTLYAADGVTVIEAKAGSDTATSADMSTRLVDGATYVVAVSVRDSTGLWSAEDRVTIAVSFALPATPTVDVAWTPDEGACTLTVSVPDPVAPQIDATHVELFRSIEGGEWARVADVPLTPPPDRVNLITNPSFEVDTTGWAPGGGSTIARVTTEAWNGTASLSLTGASGAYLQWTPVLIAPNTARTYSLYVKGSGSVQMELRARNGNAGNVTTITVSSPVVTLTSAWQRVSVTVVGDADTTNMWPLFYVRSAGTTAYIDGVLLEDSGLVGDYFEGSVPQPSVATVTDYIPALNASNVYKAVAVTDLPSSAESAPVEVITSGASRLFVNAGPGFAESVRVESNVDVEVSRGRARALRRAAGRSLPVVFDGEALTTEVRIGATLWRPDRTPERAARSSTWQQVAAFASLPSPACFRNPDGNRLFVAMSPVRIAGLGTGAARSVSWSLSEVAYSEPTS